MKSIFICKYIILVALGVMTISSCNEFLDEKPVAAASEEAVFSNPNSALQAVLGVYNRSAGQNGFGSDLSITFPFDTDEMVGFLNGAITDAQRQLNSYDLNAGNTLLASVFNRLYNGIERANLCIYNIPRMAMYTEGTDAQKRELLRLHGEALTLRALFYAELIKLWGDVPVTFVPASQLTNYDLPKTDRDIIYDQILEDLREAAEMVPWRGEPGIALDERITKGAVKALRARIALFRGGYSLRRESRQMERRSDYLTFYAIARDECFEIMQRTDIHRLNPSFQAVWQDALLAGRIEPNGEVLFEVAMAGETANSDSRLGSWNGIRVVSGSLTFGNNRNYIVPTHFYAFSPYDKRRDVSCAPFSIINGNYNAVPLINIADGKWRRDWLTPLIPLNEGRVFYGINWPLIRYSDVLLMYAEAVNELSGPTEEAIEAVNQVRRRSWAVGGIKQITITNGGTGYTAVPTVSFTGGGGMGATAVARITDGSISAIDIINVGTNYSSAPEVTLTGGNGTGFNATVTLSVLADADLTTAQVADKESFFDAIQHERLLEFTSEGIRKYDLIRWNLLGTKLDETRNELIKMVNRTAPYDTLPLMMFYQANSTEGLIWGNSFYAVSPDDVPEGYEAADWLQSVTLAEIVEKFAVHFVPNKSELLPIAQTVIDASHGSITQDYGY